MAGNDSELLRLLHGELPPVQAEALRRKLTADVALRAQYAALEGVWRGLGADPVVDPRPGFTTAVAARVRAEGRPGASLTWSLAPAWAKATAVLALVAGAAIGSSLMLIGVDATTAATASSVDSASMTLADDYAAALQSPDAESESADSEARQ